MNHHLVVVVVMMMRLYLLLPTTTTHLVVVCNILDIHDVVVSWMPYYCIAYLSLSLSAQYHYNYLSFVLSEASGLQVVRMIVVNPILYSIIVRIF